MIVTFTSAALLLRGHVSTTRSPLPIRADTTALGVRHLWNGDASQHALPVMIKTNGRTLPGAKGEVLEEVLAATGIDCSDLEGRHEGVVHFIERIERRVHRRGCDTALYETAFDGGPTAVFFEVYRDHQACRACRTGPGFDCLPTL